MSTKSIYQFHITWAITAALPFVLMYGGNVALADDKEPCVFVLDNQEDYDKKMEDCFKASGLGNYTEIGEAVEKANGSMDKFDFDDKVSNINITYSKTKYYESHECVKGLFIFFFSVSINASTKDMTW